MIKTALLLAATLCALATAPAQAEPVNQRERHQGHRIYSGVQSGQLNRGETARVTRNLSHVQRAENRMRLSGGRYTVGERHATQNMLDRSSRRLYRLKHNNR